MVIPLDRDHFQAKRSLVVKNKLNSQRLLDVIDCLHCRHLGKILDNAFV